MCIAHRMYTVKLLKSFSVAFEVGQTSSKTQNDVNRFTVKILRAIHSSDNHAYIYKCGPLYSFVERVSLKQIMVIHTMTSLHFINIGVAVLFQEINNN